MPLITMQVRKEPASQQTLLQLLTARLGLTFRSLLSISASILQSRWTIFYVRNIGDRGKLARFPAQAEH